MNITPPGTEPGPTFTAPPPPRPPGRPPWRFQRREHGKLLAGVTTGMADAFHIDVTVVRVIWVIVTVASFGLGVAAYAICWLAFPSEINPAPISQIHLGHLGRKWNAGYMVGVVLLAIGAIVVISQFGRTHYVHNVGAVPWAVVLIAGGVAILVVRHPDEDDDTPSPVAADSVGSADGTATEPPAPTITELDDATDAVDATTDAAPEAPWAPPVIPGPPAPPIPPSSSAWTQSQPWPMPRPPRPRRPRRRPFVTPITISILLIGAGAAALLDSADVVHLTVAGVLASGLIVVGVAMVISTWFGRAHGLIPIGVLLLLVTIPAVSIDVPISGGIGDRVYRPTTRSEIQSHYKSGIGQLAIDLRNVPLTKRVTSISAQLGIGELTVDVPSNVRVDVRTHVGAGHIELFGGAEGGWPDNPTAVAGINQRGFLHLDLRVGAGAIIVRRWDSQGELLYNP